MQPGGFLGPLEITMGPSCGNAIFSGEFPKNMKPAKRSKDLPKPFLDTRHNFLNKEILLAIIPGITLTNNEIKYILKVIKC